MEETKGTWLGEKFHHSQKQDQFVDKCFLSDHRHGLHMQVL